MKPKVTFLKDDPKSGMFLRKSITYGVAEQHVTEIAVWKVMYGWRVRVGRHQKGEFLDTYDLDLCAGDIPEFIALIYNTVYYVIHKHIRDLQLGDKPQDYSTFIPKFTVKPIWKDSKFEEFLEITTRMDIIPEDIIRITDDQLTEWSMKYWKNHGK